MVSVGHTVPFFWDGTPDDLPDRMADLTDRAVYDRRGDREPDALSALAAIVSPDHRQGVPSAEVLRAMGSLARENDLSSFVAPVRPTLKGAYPLTTLLAVRPVGEG